MSTLCRLPGDRDIRADLYAKHCRRTLIHDSQFQHSARPDDRQKRHGGLLSIGSENSGRFMIVAHDSHGIIAGHIAKQLFANIGNQIPKNKTYWYKAKSKICK